MLHGVYTALVTPFNRDGSIDIGAYRSFIEFQIENGVDGLVPVGTTGESPTLSEKEKDFLIQTTVECADGRIPVIAGSGCNSTERAVEATRRAAELGADYTLQVAPYYNKPSQEGLFRHFTTVAEEGGLPVVLYNVPGRSGITLQSELILRLSSHERIVALKEAGGSIQAVEELLSLLPESFSVLSGDDAMTYPLMALGGKGVISVASNAFPAEMVELTHAITEGRFTDALRTHNRLYSFFVGQFIETNPVPVKTLLAEKGLMQEVFRLPLCELTAEHRQSLFNSLPA